MSEISNFQGWGNGHTAEDFANLVNSQLGDQEHGVVTVPFEDETLPDHIVLGGVLELQGQTLTYVMLFSGALKHFHGIRAGGFRAVPVDSPPFSMALELSVTKTIEG
jgi:hypothetical protein